MLIEAEPLDARAFEGFGDVLEPGSNGSERMTNMDFFRRGLIRFPEGQATDDPAILDAFDYWPRVTDLPDDPKIGLLEARPRAMEVHYLERHVRGTQVTLNLGPDPVVLVVAPADLAAEPGPALSAALPQARAFVMEAGTGVNIGRGVWHWPPFPVGDRAARCLMVVRAAAGQDDYTFGAVSAALEGPLRVRLKDAG